MAILTELLEAVQQNFSLQLLLCLGVLPCLQLGRIFYNLYLHPLAGYPGPKLWAASRVPFIKALLTATLVKRTRCLHEKYGPIVRIAPDEISFATEEAWNDIYCRRAGHKRPPRDKTVYIAPEDIVDNIVTTADPKFHSRARSLLSKAFTEETARASYPLVESHADLFIHKLSDMAYQSPERGALVNLSDWMTFFTMDVISDLAFGESFGNLSSGTYHAWVRTLFEFVKGLTLAAAPRYYSIALTDFAFQKLLPKSVVEGQKAHKRWADEKVDRRLDSQSSRPDFMTPFMKENADYKIMSRAEIQSTFNFVILGASETTATVLVGIFNHLIRKRDVLGRLVLEVRTQFQKEEDIKLDALHENALPYLEAVINEGLRICNPIPVGLPRVVPQGGDTYSGAFLPQGTRMRVHPFTVCRSAKYFHKPDDFCPERWLAPEHRPFEFASDHLTASKPFGIGFSACLGQRMAMANMRLVISRTLWSFDVSEEPGQSGDFDDWPMPSFVDKGPMNVRMRMRTRTSSPEFGKEGKNWET